MLKSVGSGEQQIRISEMAESQPRIVLPMLFTYLPFTNNFDVTIERVVPLFIALNYRTIIIELMGCLCSLMIVTRSR